MHYLLIYDLAADYLEKRATFRGAHLKLAWEAQERGELVLGGPLMEPTDSAVLIFKGESPEAAMRFAETDPYVRNGVVKAWRVRLWNTVVGQDASAPLRPGNL